MSDRWLADAGTLVPLTALAHGSSLGVPAAELRGRSVLLATEDQLSAALALIELDGVARRIVLCPPDLPPEHLSAVAGTAEAEAVVTDSRARIASAFRHTGADRYPRSGRTSGG